MRLDNFCCDCPFFKNWSQVESLAYSFHFKCFEGSCQQEMHTGHAAQICQHGNYMPWIFSAKYVQSLNWLLTSADGKENPVVPAKCYMNWKANAAWEHPDFCSTEIFEANSKKYGCSIPSSQECEAHQVNISCLKYLLCVSKTSHYLCNMFGTKFFKPQTPEWLTAFCYLTPAAAVERYN